MSPVIPQRSEAPDATGGIRKPTARRRRCATSRMPTRSHGSQRYALLREREEGARSARRSPGASRVRYCVLPWHQPTFSAARPADSSPGVRRSVTSTPTRRSHCRRRGAGTLGTCPPPPRPPTAARWAPHRRVPRHPRDRARRDAWSRASAPATGTTSCCLPMPCRCGRGPAGRSGTLSTCSAPLDIARRPGGHVVVLPWCTERVDVFVGRRRAASSPLSGGEVVTLVVSALRGTAEAHRGRSGDEAGPQGTWWLTDAGRPGVRARRGCRRRGRCATPIWKTSRRGCDDRVVSRLLVARDGRAGPTARARVARRGALEAALFDACAPQPLWRRPIFRAPRVRDLEPPALRAARRPGATDGAWAAAARRDRPSRGRGARGRRSR